MDSTNGSGKPGGRRRRKQQAESGVDQAFDRWLERGLHRLYDDVAKEPIPDELLRLIEGDKTNRGS